MSQSDEIARLCRENDRLAAQVAALIAERDRLADERDGWRSLLKSELGARLDLLGESVGITERLAMARRQRNACRCWADRLALSLSLCNDGDVILLAYRQWRGDQP